MSIEGTIADHLEATRPIVSLTVQVIGGPNAGKTASAPDLLSIGSALVVGLGALLAFRERGKGDE